MCETCRASPLERAEGATETAQGDGEVTARASAISVILLSLAIVLLSACGGSSDQGAETSINESDQSLAKSSLPRRSEFPTGWQRVKERGLPAAVLEECFTPDYEGATVTGSADSGFELRDEASEYSRTIVYSSAAGAQKVYAQLADEALADCLASTFERTSTDEATVTNAEGGRVSFPSVGDKSDAWQTTIEIETQAGTLDVHFDLVAIRDGRTVSLLTFTDFDGPFSPHQEVELARAVATRMAATG